MPRSNRIAPGGWVFHVMNRGNARMRIFEKDADYRAFEGILDETLALFRMRLLSYCLMPNHWHLILWPRDDGDLGRFMHRLTVTHVRRWHLHHDSVGTGHLYQGIYKSLPVQQDEHFLTVCRYVERNPLRAELVDRAEAWPWSSLSTRDLSAAQQRLRSKPTLTDWPVERPRAWCQFVNAPQTDEELEALSYALQRGRPYGSETWQRLAATRLDLQSSLRPRGRPRKKGISPIA